MTLTLGGLAQMDRHLVENTKVAGSIPTGGKLFAQTNLPFTMKQYKKDNMANFV